MSRKWIGAAGLLVPALVIAFIIWLIAKQGDTKSDTVAASVELTGLPENVEARVKPPRVEIIVIFPKTFIDQVMQPGVFRVELPVEDLADPQVTGPEWAKTTRALLTSYVNTRDLPRSIKVLGAVPDVVEVEARLFTLETEVQARWSGTPAEGYEVRTARVSPARVRLTGAPGLLDSLRDEKGQPKPVLSDMLDVSGASSDLSMLVPLKLPDRVTRIDGDRSGYVEVTAEIREQIVTRSIENVEIRYPYPTTLKVSIQPPSTEIKVTGPRSLVNQIGADSFRFEPDTTPIEEPGRVQILRFFPRFKNESLEETVKAEATERTVTVTFEGTKPTPVVPVAPPPGFRLDLPE